MVYSGLLCRGLFNSGDYVQTVLCHYNLLVLIDEKNELYHSLLLKVIMLHKY